MDQVITWLKSFLKPVLDWIAETFSLTGTDHPVRYAFIIFAAVVVLVIFLIVLTIVLCVKGSKRKKAAKLAKAKPVEEIKEAPAEKEKAEEEKAEEEKAEEEKVEEPVEEISPAPVEVEEEVKEETPVEETTESPVVAEEEKVEETEVEEVPVEETKEEPVEEKVEEPQEEAKEEQAPVEEEPVVASKDIEEVVEEKKDEEVPAEELKVEETKEEVKEEPSEEVKEEPVEEKVVDEIPAVIPEKPKKASSLKKGNVKKGSEKKVETKGKVEEEVVATPKATKAGPKALGKFIISEELGNYRYRLKASNGELLVVSELYTNMESCRKGIETLKKNLANDTAKIEIVEDKHGLFSFRVMTKQGRCLATSANYKDSKRAVSASESTKRWAATERIESEETEADHSEVEEYTEEVEQIEGGKFKITNEDDTFIYQLVASNGQVIASSQQYKSEKTCTEALENFRKLAYEGKFYIFKDKNDKFQYKLYNKQKRMIMAGEVYADKARAVAVITSIKRFAGLAKIVNE